MRAHSHEIFFRRVAEDHTLSCLVRFILEVSQPYDVEHIPFSQKHWIEQKAYQAYPGLSRIMKHYHGLCDIICNYVLMHDLMGHELYAFYHTLKKYRGYLEGFTPSDYLEATYASLLQKGHNVYQKKIKLSELESLASTHFLISQSFWHYGLLYFFNHHPDAIFPHQVMWNQQSINRTIWFDYLSHAKRGMILKCIMFNQNLLGFDGHVMLVKKVHEHVFACFDPNEGEFLGLSFDGLCEMLCEKMRSLNYASMVFLDAEASLNRIMTKRRAYFQVAPLWREMEPVLTLDPLLQAFQAFTKSQVCSDEMLMKMLEGPLGIRFPDVVSSLPLPYLQEKKHASLYRLDLLRYRQAAFSWHRLLKLSPYVSFHLKIVDAPIYQHGFSLKKVMLNPSDQENILYTIAWVLEQSGMKTPYHWGILFSILDAPQCLDVLEIYHQELLECLHSGRDVALAFSYLSHDAEKLKILDRFYQEHPQVSIHSFYELSLVESYLSPAYFFKLFRSSWEPNIQCLEDWVLYFQEYEGEGDALMVERGPCWIQSTRSCYLLSFFLEVMARMGCLNDVPWSSLSLGSSWCLEDIATLEKLRLFLPESLWDRWLLSLMEDDVLLNLMIKERYKQMPTIPEFYFHQLCQKIFMKLEPFDQFDFLLKSGVLSDAILSEPIRALLSEAFLLAVIEYAGLTFFCLEIRKLSRAVKDVILDALEPNLEQIITKRHDLDRLKTCFDLDRINAITQNINLHHQASFFREDHTASCGCGLLRWQP